MNQILFETKEINIGLAVTASAIYILVTLFFLGMGIFLCRKGRLKWDTCGCVLVALLALLIFEFYALIQVPIQKVALYDRYQAGDYLTETGHVRIVYNEDNMEEYFFVVNETVFSLDDRQAYNFSCKDHELCVYDGQYIRVSYVRYRGKNLIMRIEEVAH